MKRINSYKSIEVKSYKEEYGDRNFCTVVALHVITNRPMEDCAGYMQHFGRRQNTGMSFIEIHRALTSMRLHKVKEGPYSYNNRITINQFLKKHPRGKYYCIVRGHALAIVDGVLYDHTDKPRRQITKAYRIYHKEEIL